MKKTLFLVIMAFALAVCASADNALSPVFYKMKAGDKISLKGNFCVFNGSAPNVRFVTDDNKILGVGKEESCSNEDVNKILSLQVENDAVYEVEAVFEYAGNVNLDSPASSVIDFASVEISPGASVKKKIYFVMEEDASSDNIWYEMKPSYVEVGL